MSATQTYEDYLRGQVERGQYGVAIIQAQIALDIAEYIEKHRQPTIEPERKKGRWIEHNPHKWGLGIVFECSECGEKIDCEPSNYCPNCGAEMRDSVETARDIVHEAIDNSVWSDTVDTAKIHKVVDDKYAEMTEGEG